MTGFIKMADLAAWRKWLQSNHAREREIWMIFPKGRKEGCVTYGDALDEALCWGWIDSLIKRIDDASYARKFTPRTNARKWSAVNVRRMKALLMSGRVQPSGRAVFKPEAVKGPPRQRVLETPAEFLHALATNARAEAFFESLAPSYRRNYIGWIQLAQQPETRVRRAREAVRLLAKGVKSLLK